jgi:hypothetical protein
LLSKPPSLSLSFALPSLLLLLPLLLLLLAAPWPGWQLQLRELASGLPAPSLAGGRGSWGELTSRPGRKNRTTAPARPGTATTAACASAPAKQAADTAESALTQRRGRAAGSDCVRERQTQQRR